MKRISETGEVLYSPYDIAVMFATTPPCVYKWIKSGKLTAEWCVGHWLIPASSVEQLKKKNEEKVREYVAV